MICPESGREWFVLECIYDWEEPTPPDKDRFSLRRRHIQYLLKSYLVKLDDEERFYIWVKDQHFMGRWIPIGMKRQIFSWGSFFGHLPSTISAAPVMVTKAGQKAIHGLYHAKCLLQQISICRSVVMTVQLVMQSPFIFQPSGLLTK